MMLVRNVSTTLPSLCNCCYESLEKITISTGRQQKTMQKWEALRKTFQQGSLALLLNITSLLCANFAGTEQFALLQINLFTVAIGMSLVQWSPNQVQYRSSNRRRKERNHYVVVVTNLFPKGILSVIE